MLRITLALISTFTLVVTSAATSLAESHPAPSTSGAGEVATTPPVVTSTPNTGVGLLPDQFPISLLVGLAVLAGVCALLALAARQEQHA